MLEQERHVPSERDVVGCRARIAARGGVAGAGHGRGDPEGGEAAAGEGYVLCVADGHDAAEEEDDGAGGGGSAAGVGEGAVGGEGEDVLLCAELFIVWI